MSDVLYYISGCLAVILTPALIIYTVMALVKPHIVNKRLKKPISRKRILAIGLISVAIAFFGFGSVMAATMPASVRASIAAQQAADTKAAALKLQQEQAAKQKAIDDAKPVIKTETSTETVPFTSSTQDDSNLSKGQTQVSVKGVDGVRTISYSVTYVNGKKTNKEQVKSEITTQPINQVILSGTYVAPPPASASTNTNTSTTPTGATAQCNDGSYSYSQSRSGTCSHHGGVAVWL